jgi:hypothetical protein
MSTGELTLGGLIRSLFPAGYVDYPAYEAGLSSAKEGERPAIKRTISFENPPCLATDLFAIAAALLQRSGAYHHVTPALEGESDSRSLNISDAERRKWIKAGRTWRGEGRKFLPAPPADLRRAWRELISCEDLPLYRALAPQSGPRRWWRPAMALLAIADEAARDIGFETGRPKSAQAAHIELPLRLSSAKGQPIYTLSSADRDHLCVLPKSRTPRVGCTLRSLSHHLAVLPPRGLARAYWSPDPSIEEGTTLSEPAPFNIVVVPYPYRVRATAFRARPAEDHSWGWFEVEPHWCPRTAEDGLEEGFHGFFTYVESLLDAAARDVGTVHGLVFPESAMSDGVFRRLCMELRNRPGFELLIAGLFDALVGSEVRDGNFAAMARFVHAKGQTSFDISVREKHHRWKIDGSQIEAYALGSALDVNHGWWEFLQIHSRSLDVFVMRGGATVTTLICEDLARSDPCQELVRGIGPNLVFALLMDGAQIKERWPARYATVLADDPGSSVLTLTSYGLVHRANETGRFGVSHQIGLWRDDAGKVVELSLDGGAQALCLSLQPTVTVERTLDGRSDEGDAQSWRLTGVSPVRIPVSENAGSRILDGLWPTPSGT